MRSKRSTVCWWHLQRVYWEWIKADEKEEAFVFHFYFISFLVSLLLPYHSSCWSGDSCCEIPGHERQQEMHWWNKHFLDLWKRHARCTPSPVSIPHFSQVTHTPQPLCHSNWQSTSVQSFKTMCLTLMCDFKKKKNVLYIFLTSLFAVFSHFNLAELCAVLYNIDGP